tara:strand:+ start:419 stop:601 length:183 start_codon:yes stop_codon:yes gene_type:complete
MNPKNNLRETDSFVSNFLPPDGVDVNIKWDLNTGLQLGIIMFLAVAGGIVLAGSLLKTKV